MIGIDLVHLPRIEKILLEKPRWVSRFFSEQEVLVFRERGWKAEHIGGAYAAKEAFSKALGTGIRGFFLREIEVFHTPEGKPYLMLSNNIVETHFLKGKKIELSISHDGEYATAIAIIREDRCDLPLQQ